MSFKHMAWAMEVRVGDPLAKLLLVALADRADKERGQCWPSLSRLCEDTEMSKASVTRRLSYLEQQGFVHRTQRDQSSTLYTLPLTEPTMSLTETPPCLSQRHKPISNNLSENQDIMFEDFWQVYPKKVGKGQARIAFRSAIKKATKDELISSAQAFAQQHAATDKQFVPHASTWLNGERWLDESNQSSWGDL
jgi:DNA-binding MarR family transcriptional regulator